MLVEEALEDLEASAQQVVMLRVLLVPEWCSRKADYQPCAAWKLEGLIEQQVVAFVKKDGRVRIKFAETRLLQLISSHQLEVEATVVTSQLSVDGLLAVFHVLVRENDD